jgi:TetR/AcrR family transcriptional regulator, cholesterol catabolism regulator
MVAAHRRRDRPSRDHASRDHPGRDQSGRERITAAAAELFLQNGYAQTSLRDIAAAAGIKAGSIYYHFDSKEALLTDILQQGIRVMEEAFARASEETGAEDGEARVRHHIQAHLSALFEHGPYTTNHVSAFHIAPRSVKEAVIPARDRYEAAWVALIEDLVARGEMTDEVSPALSRLALFGAMNFAVEWFDPTRGNLDELVNVITRQFWSGVGAR